MSFIIRSVFCGALSVSHLILSAAEVTVDSVKPFTSLCIGENSTGFDWRGGKWMQTNFKPDKYLLKKIDYEKAMLSPNAIDRPILCNKPSFKSYNTSALAFVKACYSFTRFGGPSISWIESKMCLESFRSGSFDEINCEGVGRFKPNGLFVKLPSSTSTSLGSEPEKDSLNLEVGTCSVL